MVLGPTGDRGVAGIDGAGSESVETEGDVMSATFVFIP